MNIGKFSDKGLNHVAIIPDGNRRWARERNLLPWQGHEEGAKRIQDIMEVVSKTDISYLTFWVASKDNLQRRSKQEVNFLFKLFTQNFKRLLKREELNKQQIRVRILGDWIELAPNSLKKVIREITEKTRTNNKRHLTFLLGYNGVDEMLNGIKSLIKKPPLKITKEAVKKTLITSDLPPVDLLIRTGGEPHNSAGFMMWHTAYSQYFFTPKYFPSFNKKEFLKALNDFLERERRFGA